MKLTNSAVEKFVCPEGKKQAVLWDSETRGFGLRVSPSGTRTYILQYRVKGSKQERQVTIGRHNDPWRVEDARKKAVKVKAQMIEGEDPVLEAQRAKETQAKQVEEDKALSMTLRQVMEHYLTHRRTRAGTPLRETSQRDIRRHVTTNLAAWADQPVANITRDACLAKFTEMSDRAPGQASQCMVNLRALCNHARELYANEDGSYRILVVNPVQRMIKIRKLNKTAARTGRIPLDRVGAVWNALQKRREGARLVEDRTAADWVCFMLLTGTRRTESGALMWSNVDLDAGTFHLSAEVVKNHNGTTLPMCTALRDMLKARRELPTASDKVVQRRKRNPERESSPYVFPSWGKTGHITNAQSTMLAVAEAAGVKVSIHDLRRTLDDIATRCKVGENESRQLLNHLASDTHGKHYSNNPDPATLLPAVESIGKWVTDQAAIAQAVATGVNVVALRA
jgi:integrase